MLRKLLALLRSSEFSACRGNLLVLLFRIKASPKDWTSNTEKNREGSDVGAAIRLTRMFSWFELAPEMITWKGIIGETAAFQVTKELVPMWPGFYVGFRPCGRPSDEGYNYPGSDRSCSTEVAAQGFARSPTFRRYPLRYPLKCPLGCVDWEESGVSMAYHHRFWEPPT